MQNCALPVSHEFGDALGQTHPPSWHSVESGQSTPHAPQFVGSSVRLAHCVGALTGHATVPVSHVNAQPVGVHSIPASQTTPQAPQLSRSAVKLVQKTPPSEPQALGVSPWHLHWPFTQRCWLGQALPHPLQFESSRCASTHWPPQFRCVVKHDSTQLPASHAWPAAHALLQVPQLAGSRFVSAQRAPQVARLAGQDVAQPPSLQTSPAGHALPQPPQLRSSETIETQPASQAVPPAGQTTVQAPLTQETPVAHAVPQAPQWSASRRMSLQDPAHEVWPVGHGLGAIVAPLQPTTRKVTANEKPRIEITTGRGLQETTE